MPSNKPTLIHQILSLTLLLSVFTQQSVQAASPTLPSGGTFVAGSGNITSTNNAVIIHQNGTRGVIDWSNFSIGQNNLVQFLNGSGATMNRVTGSQMSSILGSLTATGTVYLINPQGILVGPKGQINTGGDFLASTLNLPNAAFMAGGSLILSGNSAAFIKNLGAISSSGGSVFLFANNIANSGSIKAPNGTAGLATGQQILLSDSTSDQRIFVQAAGGDLATTGKIEAAQAELRSNGGNIYALAGNANGAITATGTATKDGRVWLIAEKGKATVDQAITARNADGLGGKIETSGQSVVTGANAKITTGRGGNWLLDPDDLTIDSTLAGTIATSLNGSTDVVEQTAAPVSGGHSDILVTSNISWSTAATLTLTAYRNVTFSSGVHISNTNAGNLQLIADNTGTGTGTINLVSGAINWSGSTGKVNLFYNPSGSANTKYTAPTSFSSGESANGGVASQFNAFMLVNNMTDLGNINTNLAGSYGLSTNLDATGVTNFTPIAASVAGGFTGKFDGGGNKIDGLTINDATHTNVGLFSKLASGSLVRNLQLTNLSVTGSTGSKVGGLAGTNQGTVSQVFAEGTITGSTTSATGGMVGANTGTIVDSYSDTFVTGNSTVTGGLVGNNSGGTIATSYATGPVTAGNGLTGDLSSTGTVTNSYFNTDTTGQAASSGGGTGQTEAQLESGLPTGFSSGIWSFVDNSGSLSVSSRPYLINQFPAGTTPNLLNGGVYTDIYQTSPVTGAAIIALVGGNRTAAAISGANGFYQMVLPQSVTNGVYVYANSVVSGGTFIDNGIPLQTVGFNNIDNPGAIISNYATFYGTNSESLNSTLADMQSATGTLPTSKTLITIGSGGSSLSTTHNVNINDNSPAGNIGIDVPITANTLTITGQTPDVHQTSPLTLGSLFWDTGSLEGIVLTDTANVIGTVAGGSHSIGLSGNIYDSASVSIGTAAGVSGINSGQVTVQSAQAVTVDSASASTHLILVDGTSFTNNAGSSSLAPGFQVWSQYPANDNRGGLSYDYKQYGATFGITPPAGGYGQSGFLYVQVPNLTATLTGNILKPYDTTTAASADATQIVYANMIDGDAATGTGTGTYNNKNAGSGKQVTINSFNTTATNGSAVVYGYVDPPSAIGNVGTITPLPINFNINGTNRQYNGTTVANGTIDPTVSTPVLTGDSVAVGGVTLNFATKNVGNNKTITPTGTAVLGGADAGNYSLGTVSTGSANVTAAPISIIYTANSKVYDGTAAATGTDALSGLFGSDNVTIQGTPTATFAATGASFPNRGKDVGNNKTVNVTGLTLGGTDLSNYSWSGSVTGTGNITPLPLSASITVTPKVYDGTTAASISGSGAVSGVLSGDTVNVGGSATYAFADRNVGTNKPIAVSGLTLTGADAGDYSATTVSATGNITPKAATATLTGTNKVYDGTNSATGTIGALSGIVAADAGTVSVSSSGTFQFADKNVANGKTVTDTGATLNSNNYTFTVNNGTANITQATATATVTGANKVYDQGTNDAGASVALSGVFDVASLAGTASYSFTGANPNQVGNGKAVTVTGLSLTGADANNYNLVVGNGLANITPHPLSASVTINNKQYDGTTSATGSVGSLSGVISGDSVSLGAGSAVFSFLTPDVANGKTVSQTGLTLTGSQAADYTATTITGNANITAKPVTATISANNKVYDTTNSGTGSMTLSGVISGDLGNVSTTGAGYAFASPNVANGITVTESGGTLSGTKAINYSLGSVSTTTANITPATLTATISANNKVYNGNTTASGNMTLTGLLGSDTSTISGDTYNFNSLHAGNGRTVTESGATLGNGNYSLGSVGTTTANITPASLTATISANGKTYNTNTTATGSMTLSGLLGGDTSTISGDTYAFNSSHAGSRTVTESGAVLGNSDYTLASVGTTTATITPATLTATTSANGKTYDQTTVTTGSMTLSGLLGGDTSAVTGDTYHFASANRGNNIVVTESGATPTNNDYSLGSVGTTTATINPLALTATTAAASKTYNQSTATTGTTTLVGVLGGDTVNVSNDTYAFNTIHAGNGLTVTESGATLSNNNYSLAAGAVATTTANINPIVENATISASSKTYNGNTNASGSLTLSSTPLSGDVVNHSGDTYHFASSNAGNGITVTESGATLSNSDYTLGTVATTTANITQAPLTATITASNKVYNTNTADTGTITLNGLLGSDTSTVSGSTYSFNTPHVGNGLTVTESGATLGNSNYTLGSVGTTTANITPAPLTGNITASGKTYNANTTATGSMTLSGLLGGDTSAISGDTYAFSSPHAGSRTVTESGAVLGNSDYTLAPVGTTTATIAPATLTASISANGKTYDKTTLTSGSMTLSGLLGTDTSTISGDTYHFSSANRGNGIVVTESGATLGNSDYSLGSVSTTTASINPLALTATTTAASKTYNQSTATTGTTTLVGVLSGDTVNISNDTYAFNTIHAGNGLTVTESGATLSNNNYSLAAGSVATTTANINPLVENATISANSKTYNGNTNASGTLTLSTTPLSGDVVNHSGDTYHFASSNAGNGITVTESGASLSNSDYTLGTVATTTANITQAPLTATISASNKVYNTNTTDTGTITLNGLLGSDTSTVSGATYNFNTPHVGNGLTVTESGATLGNSNYTLSSVGTTTANITPAPLTAALNATNRVYNATTVASGTIGALSGVLSGDTISINNPGSFAFANKNVGNSKTVTDTGATLQGTNPGDYSLTVANGSANITAAPLTASFSANNKIYDGTPTATGSVSALTGVLSGDTVTFSPGAFTFADKNVANGKAVTVGGSPLAGTDAGNYSLSVNNSTANITAAPLTGTTTANNKVYDATTAATGGVALTGVIGSDNVLLTGATYSFATKNVGTGKTVTESGGTLAGTDANNYALGSIANGTASITQAQLTAALAANGKVYDGNTVATGTIGSLSGVLANDVVNLGTQGSFGFSDKNVGNGKTVTASGTTLQGIDAANYNLSVANGTATITPATLTGTTTASNKVYNGNTTAAGSLTLNGVVSGETVSATGGTYAFADKNVGTGKTVTESGATLTGAGAGNYILGSIASTTANITAAQLTAGLTASNKVYNGNIAAAGTIGSLTGVVSGDAVSIGNPGSFTFSDKNVANGKTVTASGTTLQGNDAANYSLNVSNGSANITPAQLTGVVAANGKVYDATTAATGTLTLSGAIAGDQVTAGSTGFSFADKNVGTGKSVSASGVTLSGTDAPNYSLSAVTNGTADITPATLTGITTASNKVYNGNTNTVGSLTLSGVIAGDTVSSTGATYAFANKNVGNGIAVTESGATLAGIDGGNYTLSNVANATANITPATLTGSVIGANKTYDGTVADAASLTLNGVVGNDQVTAAATYAFNNKNAGTGKPVVANNATLSGTDAANYTVGSISNGTANITPATLTASVNGTNKTYDGTLTDNATLTLSGVVGNDQVIGSAVYAFNNKNVGIGKTVAASNTSISGADSANYTVGSVVNGTADITPATLTASVAGANKAYDATTADNAALILAGVIGNDQVSGAGAYAFNDKNVGTGKAVTATNPVLSGADAANYTVGSIANGTANVTPATLTAAVTANNKVYDSTTVATGSVGVTTGVLGQDTVSIGNTGSLQFADKNAGTGKSVNAVGQTLTGADAGNYTLTVTPGLANITPAQLTASITASDKTYDATTAATGALTLHGVLGQDTVTAAGTTYAFNTPNAGTGIPVTATGTTLSGADHGNYTLASVGTAAAAIDPATLTYTFTGSPVPSGSSLPALTGTVTGLVGGQTLVSATTGTPAFTTTATSSSAPGQYPVVGSGLQAVNGNYVFAQAASNAQGLVITTPVNTGTGTGSTGTGTGSTGTGTGSTGTGTGSTGTGTGSTGTGTGSTGTGTGSSGTGTGSTGTGTGSTGTGTGSTSTGTSLGSNGTGSSSTGSVNGSTYVAGNFTAAATLQTGAPIATGTASANGSSSASSANGSSTATATPLSLVVSVIRYTDGSAPNFGLSFAGAPVAGVDLGSISSQLALTLIQVPSSTGGAAAYQIVAKGTVANYALTLQTGTVTTIDNTARSLPTQSSAQSPVSASTNTNVAATASVSVKTASVITPDSTVASGNAISTNTVGNFGVNYSTNWTKALGENLATSGSLAASSGISAAPQAAPVAAASVTVQSGPSGQAGPAAVQSAPTATQSAPSASQSAPAAIDSPSAAPSAQPVTPAGDPPASANPTTPVDSDPTVKTSAPGSTTPTPSTIDGKPAKKQKKNEGGNR